LNELTKSAFGGASTRSQLWIPIIAVTAYALDGEAKVANAALGENSAASVLNCWVFAAVHESAFGTKADIPRRGTNVRFWG